MDVSVDMMEYSQNDLTLVNTIGEGEFGTVYLAKAYNICGNTGYSNVAVKMLKGNTLNTI